MWLCVGVVCVCLCVFLRGCTCLCVRLQRLRSTCCLFHYSDLQSQTNTHFQICIRVCVCVPLARTHIERQRDTCTHTTHVQHNSPILHSHPERDEDLVAKSCAHAPDRGTIKGACRAEVVEFDRAHMARAIILAVLVLALCSDAASQDGDSGVQCLLVVHPPPNYVMEPEEQRSIEMLLQVNCPGASRARMLQLYSATGNGTAGGLLWQVQLDQDTDEMFQLNWQLTHGGSLDAYEHWHCSGWRQWQLVVHRESGTREHALMRVRAPLLEDALEKVEKAARLRGLPPSFVQVTTCTWLPSPSPSPPPSPCARGPEKAS